MILAIIVSLVFLSVLFFLPETSHPGTRGIDKLSDNSDRPRDRNWLKLNIPVILNPFSPLLMLRSPIVLIAVSLILVFATFMLIESDLEAMIAFLILAVEYGVSRILK